VHGQLRELDEQAILFDGRTRDFRLTRSMETLEIAASDMDS